MLNFSAFYFVCLPVGHTMKVYYLSGAHFCQNVALSYFHCFFSGICLNVALSFEVLNHCSIQMAVYLNIQVEVIIMRKLFILCVCVCALCRLATLAHDILT